MGSSALHRRRAWRAHQQGGTPPVPCPPAPLLSTKTVVNLSSLFPGQVRTARGLPRPKSLPYTSNRGEPLTTTMAGSPPKSGAYLKLGFLDQDASSSLTAASSTEATARFSSQAVQLSRPSPRISPTGCLVAAPAIALPRNPVEYPSPVSCIRRGGGTSSPGPAPAPGLDTPLATGARAGPATRRWWPWPCRPSRRSLSPSASSRSPTRNGASIPAPAGTRTAWRCPPPWQRGEGSARSSRRGTTSWAAVVG